MLTYLATSNAGKLRELQALFEGSPLELRVYPAYRSVEETERTYEGNALLKAHALAHQLSDAGVPGAAVLADDSGFEVYAMGGRPGVFSARYGGASASWEQRRAMLLGELRGIPAVDRIARFVCAMALIAPDGREYVARGQVDGRVVRRPEGAGGFGYDPLFWYPPDDATFAQLRAERKNAVSHRHAAAQSLLAQLPARG